MEVRIIMATDLNDHDGGFAKKIKRMWYGSDKEQADGNGSEEPEPAVNGMAYDDSACSEVFYRSTEKDTQSTLNQDEKNPLLASAENARAAEPADNVKSISDEEERESTTVISRKTVIKSDINAEGDIELYGSVTGAVKTPGKIIICGKQNGNVQGSDVRLEGCAVRGNVSASGSVIVDSDSVVVGDIKCGSLVFGGKLKGNIHVMGNVTCEKSAVIIGNIVSTTITVESGAKLQGKVQISDGSIKDVEVPDDVKADNSSADNDKKQAKC